jgi:RHS repeat-associated protein
LIDPNGILPQVLAQTDNTGNLISFYVYDGAGLVAKITPQNQYYFYHYDGLGSTIAITDNAGQVVNTYCYSPEGLVGAQETIPNPFQFVGRFGVMAEGNGLYLMGARYYDPEVGRFINKDPIGFDGGDLNLYVYTENNPVNWTDPYGFIKVKAGYEIEFIILFTLNPYIIYKVAWIENQLPENLEIEITDSWRTFKQYKKLYPAKGWKDYIKNKHTQLRALDINAVPKASSKNKCNISKTELANLARQAGFKGIGFYNLHLHIDLRRTPATWKGESK